eukprot:9496245-Pyramimonas_sp.AAC.2
MKHCHSYRLRVATQHAPCPPKAAKRAACWRAPQAAPPRARRSAGQAWWAGGEAPARYPPRRPRRELGRPGTCARTACPLPPVRDRRRR